jgi:hypothetical protein
MNEKTARDSGIEHTIWTEAFEDNDRSLAESRKTGRIKMILALWRRNSLITMKPFSPMGELTERHEPEDTLNALKRIAG